VVALRVHLFDGYQYFLISGRTVSRWERLGASGFIWRYR